MAFPVESIPDGALTAPHHYLYPAYFAIIMSLVVWDNMPNKEPVLTLSAIVIGLFGWFHVWQFYPVTGAIIVLFGAVMATIITFAGLLDRIIVFDLPVIWSEYSLLPNLFIFMCALFMLDDAISHAFGVWTPIDALWHAHIHKFVL